jgi:predicted nucleotidyltransferase
MERATLDQTIRTLRAHQAELKAAGVRSLRIFGSVARDQAGPDSDIDLEAVKKATSERVESEAILAF